MGMVIVLLCMAVIRTKEWQTTHDLITLWRTNVSPEVLNSSKLILWHQVLVHKINTQVWLCYMKKTTITIKMIRHRGQILVGT